MVRVSTAFVLLDRVGNHQDAFRAHALSFVSNHCAFSLFLFVFMVPCLCCAVFAYIYIYIYMSVDVDVDVDMCVFHRCV